MIQLSGQVVPIKLNAEKEGRDAARKYRVSGFPAILFIDGDGKVAGTMSGYRPPGPFAEEMTKIISTHRDFPKLLAAHQAKPRDGAVAARLAAAYAGRGDRANASGTLAKAERADPLNGSGQLAKAYNAVGDLYQEARQFERAIPLFQKAAKVGKTPHDIAYANASIATCYLTQRKVKEAKPYAEKVLKMPNAPAELREGAKQMMEFIKQQGG